MQENTKKYFKDLIDNISIETNTLELEIHEIQKSLKKMRKFYNKVIVKL